MIRARHLHDDDLYEAYLTARRGIAIDPRLAEHLADCASCGRRYGDVAGMMDDLSAAADEDLEQLFPAERRRSQQERILSRIAHVGRPARVLSFPGRQTVRRLGVARPRVATRWIAAGAAAGLFIGVGLGLFLDFDSAPATTNAPVGTRQPVLSASRAPTGTFSSEADEEAFLFDLDLALESPRTRVLLGYDALTPRVRDIVDIR